MKQCERNRSSKETPNQNTPTPSTGIIQSSSIVDSSNASCRMNFNTLCNSNVINDVRRISANNKIVENASHSINSPSHVIPRTLPSHGDNGLKAISIKPQTSDEVITAQSLFAEPRKFDLNPSSRVSAIADANSHEELCTSSSQPNVDYVTSTVNTTSATSTKPVGMIFLTSHAGNTIRETSESLAKISPLCNTANITLGNNTTTSSATTAIQHRTTSSTQAASIIAADDLVESSPTSAGVRIIPKTVTTAGCTGSGVSLVQCHPHAATVTATAIATTTVTYTPSPAKYIHQTRTSVVEGGVGVVGSPVVGVPKNGQQLHTAAKVAKPTTFNPDTTKSTVVKSLTTKPLTTKPTTPQPTTTKLRLIAPSPMTGLPIPLSAKTKVSLYFPTFFFPIFHL